MDPNAALERARSATQRYYQALVAGDRPEMMAGATELADAFSDLDKWLSHDGLLPREWHSHGRGR